MAYKSHAFCAGDIISGSTKGSYRLLILEVLPEPCRYNALVLETGKIIEGGYYVKRYFRKVA